MSLSFQDGPNFKYLFLLLNHVSWLLFRQLCYCKKSVIFETKVLQKFIGQKQWLEDSKNTTTKHLTSYLLISAPYH